jgi:hypothetical protein
MTEGFLYLYGKEGFFFQFPTKPVEPEGDSNLEPLT